MRFFSKVVAFIKPNKGFAAGIAMALTLGLFIHGKPEDSYFEISKNLDIFATLFKELNTYYVDDIEPGKMIKTGIDAMLDELDPYTNYITESDIEEYEFQTTGKYGGIGANMRKLATGEFIVGDVYENSPAQMAGLHPGDGVISIDNNVIKNKTMDEISVLLKGSPGTQVAMKIKDVYTGEEVVKMVSRGEIELSSVPYAALVGPNKDVAYVTLTQFTPNCARQVRAAYDSLKTVQPKLSGAVLDLRNNPGGLLDEAVNICNIFVDRNQLIVSTKGKGEEWDKDFKTTGTAWDTKLPLAVLVNHSSASASEIVAGTIQDLDRGVVIGGRSYGKGLVQTTRPLGYNARLKLTTAKYYTPSGRCIQALDYSHRNPDGSVGAVPDSLKKTYKTISGRKVLSGGGVEPDVAIEDKDVSKIAITLYAKSYLFDYATQYAKTHKSIAGASEFQMSAAEFSEFKTWLGDKDYAYKSETEIALDTLENIAKCEQYADGAKGEIAALRAKLSHDKKSDVLKHEAEIKRLLESEIASRYYYTRGRIAQGLRDDADLKKALELISTPTKYTALLKP